MEVTQATGGPDFVSLIMIVIAALSVILLIIGLFLFLKKYFVGWIKYKDREKASLQFVLLQVKVPRGNEIKIDDYFPIKTFRDLPTDPLSSLTSALAKMQRDEGAAVQVMISPSSSKWKDVGKRWVKKEKDPGKENAPKAPPDAKQLEAVEGK